MKNGAYIDTLGNLSVRTKYGWHVYNEALGNYTSFTRYRLWRRAIDKSAIKFNWECIWEFSE